MSILEYQEMDPYKDAKEIVKYLLEDYKFEYYYTPDELKSMKFWNPEMKFPENPFFFSTAGAEDCISVMAFGGCIGTIRVGQNEDYLKGPERNSILDFAKYLGPNVAKKDKDGESTNGKEEKWFVNGHKHAFILPKKFVEAYPGDRTQSVRDKLMGDNKKARKELLLDSTYWDMMVCAAYVRFMHIEKGLTIDVSERSFQTMIGHDNLLASYQPANDHNLVVIDLEFKQEIPGKEPSVDFVVLDKDKKSFGLIEFKYQGESMNPGDDNSLTVHYRDFKTMITTDVNKTIVKRLIKHTENLIKVGVIKDTNAKACIEEMKAQVETGDAKAARDAKDMLWCGFHFADVMASVTQRANVQMTMKERILHDCKEQIYDLYKADFEEGTKPTPNWKVYFEHIDIGSDMTMKMDGDIGFPKEILDI